MEKFLKVFNWGPIVIFANGKSFLDGTQMLVYSQNSNFGKVLPFLVNFGQNQEIFQENCNFLEEISWSIISCFLVFYQEMCNSNQHFAFRMNFFLLFLIQCQTCNRVGLEDQISISFGCNFAKKSPLLLENYKSVKVIELIFNI